MRFSCDSSGDYTHLLCDTDGDDRAAGVPRGHCAHSSSATWQRLPSCSEEVSLSICVNEVTTPQGQATTRTHNLHSRTDIYYTLLCVCKYLEIQICFICFSLISLVLCLPVFRGGEEQNTQSLSSP